MLKQLIKLVRLNAVETILENPAVPLEHREAVVMEVAHQIFGGLRKHMKRDCFASVAIMVQTSGLSCDPTVKQVMGFISTSLTSKFGVPTPASQQISSSILPCVLMNFALVNGLARCSAHNFLTRYYLT